MSAVTALVELMTDRLGPPVTLRYRSGAVSGPAELLGREFGRLYRFRCLVCGGGFGDPLYRPLVVRDDGLVVCQASLRRGYGDPTCSFTVRKLARLLSELEAA